MELTIHDALNLFADYKTAEGSKLKTINGYLKHLTLFAESVSRTDELGKITASDVVAFLANEKRRGMSASTVKARDTAIDIFFNWCETMLEGFNSPIRNSRGRRIFKPPKTTRKEPRRATDTQIDALIMSIPQKQWWDMRDRAIINLLRDTGIRVNEASMMLVSSIDTNERLASILTSKNGKFRQVPFTERTAHAVASYLFVRPWCPPEISQYLCVGSSNLYGVPASRLTDSGIRQMLERRCRDAKIDYINPHSIRHLFGLRSLNSGIRAEVVSNMMGHHSVDFTIKYYAPLLTETIRSEYDQKW